MNTKLLLFNILTLLALAVVLLRGQGAGPLDPPGAPSDGVYRTLEEVYNAAADSRTPIDSLPFIIDEPGSYYLPRNLHFTDSTGDAITVDASHVTIDLNGFNLSSSAEVTGIAIAFDGFAAGGIVRNGMITGTSQNASSLGGFDFGVALPIAGQASDLIVRECRRTGISGNTTVITRCVTMYNQGSGIVAPHSSISHCVSSYNGGTGIRGSGSSIDNSVCDNNTFSNIETDKGVITGCVGTSGSLRGISGAVVVASSSTGNAITGIKARVVSQCATFDNSQAGIVDEPPGEGAVSLSSASAAAPSNANIASGTRTGNFPTP